MKSMLQGWERYVEFHTRAPFKFRYIAIIGVAAFPIYGLVWTYVFPQPYENWTLRVVGSILCAGLLTDPLWRGTRRRAFLVYCYVALMLCLPAFFTFMLLMNEANPVWLMSMMAAILFVLLLYDVLNAFVVTILGSVIGLVAFWAVAGLQPVPAAYIASVPIYLFSITAFLFLSYGERRVAEEQLQAASLLASKIAHEMRTPLLGISLDAERVRQDIHELAAVATLRTTESNPTAVVEVPDVDQMDKALARIRQHTLNANLVIDMLLTTVTHSRFEDSDLHLISLPQVVEGALERFHFQDEERERVDFQVDAPALIRGPEVLLVHVVFNLLKNSLRAISGLADGRIELRVSEDASTSYLRCRDNGRGIDPEVLPLIFMPFMTGGRSMHGTGVGLPFCRFVVQGIGGTISCESRPPRGAEFVLAIPRAKADEAAVTAPSSPLQAGGLTPPASSARALSPASGDGGLTAISPDRPLP